MQFPSLRCFSWPNCLFQGFLCFIYYLFRACNLSKSLISTLEIYLFFWASLVYVNDVHVMQYLLFRSHTKLSSIARSCEELMKYERGIFFLSYLLNY